MDFTHPKTPEETIISSLAQKSLNGESLLKQAQTIKPGFTKQALYVILRRLLAEEVIVKHGKQFSLSKIWLGKMANFFSVAQERYGTQREGVDFLSLQDGDKISYSFKSPEETDKFWGHAFDVLAETMPPQEPLYIYNPHEWFILARQESELHLFNKLKSMKRQLWLAVGHRDPLDIYVKQFFDGTYLQYHMLDTPLFEKEYYYLNIFGTYIIEAYLDIDTMHALQKFYTATSDWNEIAKKELQSIVTNGKTKLTISKNERKAKKLKKMIGEYFFPIK